MLSDQSFSTIFEAILKEEKASPLQAAAGWESHLDAFAITELLVTVSVTLPHSAKAGKRAYAVKARVPKPSRLRPPHVFDTEQTVAFNEIKRHSQHLPEGFTAAELKSAYRHCALATHPDRGGSSESFQLIRKSYHILQALVKNEA